MNHLVINLPAGVLHCWWRDTQVIATDRKVTKEEMDAVEAAISQFPSKHWFIDRAKEWGYV